MNTAQRWKLAIPTTAFGPMTVKGIIAKARSAGFDAVEATLGPEGDFAPDASDDELGGFSQRLYSAGMSISALVLAEAASASIAADDPERRATAETIRAALRAARHLAANTLIVTMSEPAPGDHPCAGVAAETAFQRTLEAMLDLRFDAQRYAVHLALRSGSDRLLASPDESRDFFDRINSPWVGACLDLGRCKTAREAGRRIDALGHRLRSVRFSSPPVSDARLVFAALRRAGYSGPITCLSAGDDLADVVSSTRAPMG